MNKILNKWFLCFHRLSRKGSLAEAPTTFLGKPRALRVTHPDKALEFNEFHKHLRRETNKQYL
jgi:hypothetical protein